MISVIADDEPTFTSEVIQYFPSKISNMRIGVDDLANVINVVPKAFKLSSVSTSTVKMIADDNPVFVAQTADVSLVNSVAISTLADDDPTTITGHGPESLGVVVQHEGDDPAVDAVVFPCVNMLYTYAHEVAPAKIPKNCAAPIVVDDPLSFEWIRNRVNSDVVSGFCTHVQTYGLMDAPLVM